MSGEYPILEKEGKTLMKIISEISISDFEAWSGGKSTLERIISEDKCDELEAVLEELYPDGMTDTQLNDLLWFSSDTVFEWLGIRTEDEIQSELEEALSELQELKQNYADDCDDEDMTEEEKSELWQSDYAEDAEELEEKIAELKEELANI